MQDALQTCINKLSASYHGIVTYQPPNRCWPLQWIETISYVGVAAVLTALCVLMVRQRAF